MSDLHIEFGVEPTVPKQVAAQTDVVVLPGDIHNGIHGLTWARNTFPSLPIIYVAGNHEYYDGDLESVFAELRQAAKEYDIAFLENDEVVIGEVRFLGTSLWTDFELYGLENKTLSIQTAKQFMVDYKTINYHGRRLTPEDTVLFYQQARTWLAGKLAEVTEKATVVVTHHLPSFACVSERYQKDYGSAAFASCLDDLVLQSDLWLCGHTHDTFDVTLGTNGKGRVVCNPRGYVRDTHSGRKKENPKWAPMLLDIA